MLTFIIIVLFFVIFFNIYPNIAIQFFIIISTVIPINFTSNAFKIVVGNIDFSINDLIFYSLILSIILKSFSNKKTFINNKYVIIFLLINLFYFFYGIIFNKNIAQSLFDIRPILFYSLLLVNFKKLNCTISPNKVIDSFLFAVALYSFMCISILYFKDSHPYFIFLEDENFIKLGRISFQQDMLLIIAIPILFNLLIDLRKHFFKKIFYNICLILCLIKLLVSMGRGLISIVLLCVLFLLIKRQKEFSLKNFIKKSFKTFLRLAIIITVLVNIQIIYSDLFSLDYLILRFADSISLDTNFQIYQINNRLLMWITGLNECIKSYFIGNGYGYTFSINHSEWAGKKISFIDSAYVTLIIRSGILSVAFLFLIYFKILQRINFLTKYNFDKVIYTPLIISIYFILIVSIFNSYIIYSISNFTLLLVLSYICNYYSFFKSKFRTLV